MDVLWLLEESHDFTDPMRCAPFVSKSEVLGSSRGALEVYRNREPAGPVVACGTLRQLTRLARDPQWGIAVWDDYEALRCQRYYAYLYPYLKRLAVLVPMNALEHMDVRALFGERVAIRPDTNTKPFEGQVCETLKLDAFVASHPARGDELVVLSEVLDLVAEYRVWCAHGEVVTASGYLSGEGGIAEEDVLSFSREVAGLVAAHGVPLLSVDVARCATGELALMEIGGVQSWGLYDADIKAYVAMMERHALVQWRAWYGG